MIQAVIINKKIKIFLGFAPEKESGDVAPEAIAAYKATIPLDDTNIGNRMLKSMGWSEGSGLGRNQQGSIQINIVN